jgi:hypothetical protein
VFRCDIPSSKPYKSESAVLYEGHSRCHKNILLLAKTVCKVGNGVYAFENI